jgi:hypothetical protein
MIGRRIGRGESETGAMFGGSRALATAAQSNVCAKLNFLRAGKFRIPGNK